MFCKVIFNVIFKKLISLLLTQNHHYKIYKIVYQKKYIPKSLKRSVWDKHVGPLIGLTKCLCCKHQSIRQIEFHCGHIISEKNGGTTTINNLIPICAQCNTSMRTQNFNDFKNKYFTKNKKENKRKIQSAYSKRIRKQTNFEFILNSTLIDFRKNLY